MAIDAGDVIWTIGADIKKFKKALGQTSKDMKGLAKEAGITSKKAGIALTAMGATGVAAMGGLISKSLEFSKAMAEVNTLGIADLEGLGDSVKDVAGRFGLDLTDAVKASYQAISAGASEAETPLLLEKAAIAAKAGITDLTTAIELGTSVTNAFGLGIGAAGQVFDEAFIAVKGGVTTFEELGASVGKLSPLMSAAGVSSGEMFASIGALTKGGIATSEAVTGMKAVIQGILKPTSDAAAMAEELGIQFDITALTTQGLGGFMDTLATATGGNIDKMGAFFSSTEALSAALALTGNQAGSFTELLGQMDNATGASQEAFDAFIAANPGEAFGQLKAQIAVLAVELGDNLVPVMTEVLKTIKPVIESVIAWTRAHPNATKNIILVVGAVSALMFVLGPLLIILPGLVSAFGIASAAAGIIATAIGAISIPLLLIGAAIVAVVALIVMNWDKLKQMTISVFNFIGNLIGNVVGGIINTIRNMLGWLGDAIAVLGQFLGLSSQANNSGGGNQGRADGGVVGMATGGVVQKFAGGGVLTEVGERGRELLALPTGTRVLSHPDMMRAAGRGAAQAGNQGDINPTFNLTFNGVEDPDDMVEKLKGPIQQWLAGELRRAKA